ncbi:lysophospholipid acyltransferase family protein [Sulfurihydrogenibium subterraneum]|uniref:lysophospholipid acyltransferase family protein n=1 Tax=Sulfurihydrogenibium subterraneum TaxID=171121 RepID=UPI00048FB78A|nr:lysophospholipid acyltransferase family protein [Sulfurihydrogenibium subterraneum]
MENNYPYSELGYKIFFKTKPFFKKFLKIEVVGVENIPLEGGCIIAANHRSHFDPPVINIISPRPVIFLAKKELFEVPILGWFIKKAGAIPVRRDSRDTTAIKKSITLLKEGFVIGIFPEGSRARPGEFRKPQPGVGYLIEKAKVPVIPVLIEGTDKVLPVNSKIPKLFKYNINVLVGKPIKFEGLSSYEHIAEKVMHEIKKLKGEHYG